MKTYQKILLVLAVPFYLVIQAPLGFYDGYTIKDRQMCADVTSGEISMRSAATGVMREGGMGSAGIIMYPFETNLHKEWRHKGMLYSLKACFDKRT